MNITQLPAGVYCAAELDDDVEVHEARTAKVFLGVVDVYDLYVINNMDFCDDRLENAALFRVSDKPDILLEGHLLSVDGIDVYDADNGIGFFIRKTDLAAFTGS